MLLKNIYKNKKVLEILDHFLPLDFEPKPFQLIVQRLKNQVTKEGGKNAAEKIAK